MKTTRGTRWFSPLEDDAGLVSSPTKSLKKAANRKKNRILFMYKRQARHKQAVNIPKKKRLKIIKTIKAKMRLKIKNAA